MKKRSRDGLAAKGLLEEREVCNMNDMKSVSRNQEFGISGLK